MIDSDSNVMMSKVMMWEWGGGVEDVNLESKIGRIY